MITVNKLIRRWTLQMMCSMLLATKTQSDEENMNLMKEAEQNKYEFGTIMSNDNLPFYKIER